MTRPVAFARLARLERDVARLHLELGLRHFPVATRPRPTIDDVIGIVTVTDLCRGYLEHLRARGVA